MGFNWKCPECGKIHHYGGSQTTRATAVKHGKNMKIWQYKFDPPANKADHQPITNDHQKITKSPPRLVLKDEEIMTMFECISSAINIHKNVRLDETGQRRKRGEGFPSVMEWVEGDAPLEVQTNSYYKKLKKQVKLYHKLKEFIE